MAQYAHPEMLVDTAWVSEHGRDAGIRLVEVDVDTAAYDQGHVSGAVAWNWTTQLCDTVQRDIIPKDAFEKLMADSGVGNDTTVILYGDNNNWFAAWALWQMKIYGHKDVRLMNGGRKKWLAEGRELTTEVPSVTKETYRAMEPDMSLRAFLPEVQRAFETRSHMLVDVRSPDEFTGKILSPPGLAETCQRGGHIPGAKSIPWGMACKEDGSFKSADELAALYQSKGVTTDKPDDRLLPDRGTLQPYMVRSEVSVGVSRREELRRLVDRMGQPGACPCGARRGNRNGGMRSVS